MKKGNNSNKLMVTVVLVVSLFVGLHLIYKKTDLFPSASRTASESRWKNRSIKAESAIVTTPVITTKANLTDALKDLDSESPEAVARDLRENDTDSQNF